MSTSRSSPTPESNISNTIKTPKAAKSRKRGQLSTQGSLKSFQSFTSLFLHFLLEEYYVSNSLDSNKRDSFATYDTFCTGNSGFLNSEGTDGMTFLKYDFTYLNSPSP